jgi:hypothetical protein
MKNKLFILAIATFAFVGTASYAQSSEESNVKILRTSRPGIIKLHYALAVNEPLSIKFYNETGLVGSDKIHGEFAKGFSKKYNVREIADEAYWVEVSSSRGSTTYRVTPQGNKAFTTMLENPADNQALVKRNN